MIEAVLAQKINRHRQILSALRYPPRANTWAPA
jgi:hypothetical protein